MELIGVDVKLVAVTGGQFDRPMDARQGAQLVERLLTAGSESDQLVSAGLMVADSDGKNRHAPQRSSQRLSR